MDRGSAKPELIHSLRTQTSEDERVYHATFQGVDNEGNLGISLKEVLVPLANEGLEGHITLDNDDSGH